MTVKPVKCLKDFNTAKVTTRNELFTQLEHKQMFCIQISGQIQTEIWIQLVIFTLHVTTCHNCIQGKRETDFNYATAAANSYMHSIYLGSVFSLVVKRSACPDRNELISWRDTIVVHVTRDGHHDFHLVVNDGSAHAPCSMPLYARYLGINVPSLVENRGLRCLHYDVKVFCFSDGKTNCSFNISSYNKYGRAQLATNQD